MINNAHDRGTAAKAMFKALGIKTHSIHFSTFPPLQVTLFASSKARPSKWAQVGAINMANGALQ